MSLLQNIQESIIQENNDLSPILLKLRLLASRLGSKTLEDWVKYESEGYPLDADIPSYRIVGVTYRGTFSGPFGSGIENAQIPPSIIEKYANDRWTKYKIRESIAAIDQLTNSNNDLIGIDASNLILLLQGKVYKDYSCNDISGLISVTSLYEIKQIVRSRVLELTFELEKAVPSARHLEFGNLLKNENETESVKQITNQIIYGNVEGALIGTSLDQVNVKIIKGDADTVVNFLVSKGFPNSCACDFVEILQSEEPINKKDPFGDKAKNWIATNLKKSAKGAINLGGAIAKKILEEAALKYYGI